MPCMNNGREIILSGAVGDDMGWGWGDCFTSADVIMALAQVGNGNDVVIRLNSGGGIATEGSAIHSAIARHAGKTTIVIEGVAASAASVVAMAGDEVVMALGALMMVHDPSGFTVGTIKEHQEQINCLTALADSMATIYAAKTGQPVEACRADMDAETWMTADQAVAKGYANRVEGAEAPNPEPIAFNYRAYSHAPAPLLALAKAKHWDKRRPNPTAQDGPAGGKDGALPPREEQRMTDKSDPKDGEAAIKARVDAAVADATATSMPRAQAADIAKACNDGGVPALAATLLAEGVTLDQARARIAQAGQVRDVVALAKRADPTIDDNLAATMIAEGRSPDQVKAALFDKLAAKSEAAPIATQHRAAAGGFDNPGATTATDARAKSRANMQAQIERSGLSTKKEG